MKHGEREELQRQGAKAAARGDTPQANPLLADPNAPTATGEDLDQWVERVQAWQSGFDAQTRLAEAAGQAEDEPGKPEVDR